MATMFAIVMAAAATTAVFAAVGAGIAAITGHNSAASTFGKVALISFQIALAAAGGMDVCNILSRPAPPGFYSEVTKMDSSVLQEMGYDSMPEALMDQPLLEASGSNVTQAKAVAENATIFENSLNLKGKAADVAGASITKSGDIGQDVPNILMGKGGNSELNTVLGDTKYKDVTFLKITKQERLIFEFPINKDLPMNKTFDSNWLDSHVYELRVSVPNNWVIKQQISDIRDVDFEWRGLGYIAHGTDASVTIYGPPE